jgi:hypothetical protein
MATITQEAMALMIAQSVQHACQAMMEQIHAQGGLGGRGPQGGGGGGGGQGRCLTSKDFANTGVFDGTETAFADWAFKFKLAMKPKNLECHRLLELHEKMKSEVQLEELEALTTGDSQKATEIYDVLGLNVSGEALTIVRGVDSLNGVEAWRRLMKRYSPNTPQRQLVRLMELLTPTKAKNATELANTMEQWELKLRVYERENGDTLDDQDRGDAQHPAERAPGHCRAEGRQVDELPGPQGRGGHVPRQQDLSRAIAHGG